MAGEVAGAAISAFGNVLGTAMNVQSTNNLNYANRKFTREMWEKTNEYNLPIHQRERLEAAGINPFAVMANNGADTGQSNQSPTPQTYQPDYSGFSNLGENILGALYMSKQNELLDQQKAIGNVNVEFARIKAINELSEIQARIGKLLEDKNLTHEQREYWEKQNYVLQNSLTSLIDRNYYESEASKVTSQNLQRQYDDAHLETEIKSTLSGWSVRMSQAQIKEISQNIQESRKRIAEINSRIDLNEQQKKNLIDEIKSNERSRVSSRLHDRLDVISNKKEFWKDFNNLMDNALSIDVPFGKISLPRPVEGATPWNGSLREIWDEYDKLGY